MWENISIHSLRMEGDTQGIFSTLSESYFNPLPPHGGRPAKIAKEVESSSISIHSLRMEGDVQLSAKILNCRHFNPLPPHGGRPGISFILFTILSFQSTPSAWRETPFFYNIFAIPIISIHSLRMEGDLLWIYRTKKL